MKKKHFKTSKGEFFLVEDDGNFPRDFPYEFYEGIGYIDDLTEDQAKEVVGGVSNGMKVSSPQSSYKYKLNRLLHSLDVHFENPMGEEPDNFVTPYTDMFTVAKRSKKHLEWQQAQSKLWNKSNTYLFKKI